MNTISPVSLLSTIAIYFVALYIVSYFTSKRADNRTFFNSNRNAPWILVAIGMIGASLSGVTFISIPGVVGAGGTNQAFSYMQMVYGYLVGYAIIALVLMPIYYKYNLISIYGYLNSRFGPVSYRSGASFFLLSRIIGASFRLYLVAIVLHPFVLEPMGISFEMTVIFTIALIWIYTHKGGIKTIIWTDTLQTVTMLLAVVFTLKAISSQLGIGFSDLPGQISSSEFGRMFFFDNGWQDPNNFFKQFISGMLIAVVMTGLDQDMMQKNLTCRSLGDAQKNILLFSVILVFANLLFLGLGASLYMYAGEMQIAIPEKSDQLFPLLALQHLSPFIGIVFVLGLIAAAYSSADSALTALTTSFCIDFLDFENSDKSEDEKKKTRFKVHVGFSIVLLFMILLFNYLNNEAVINALFTLAAYTYGPLLGLFAFGIFTSYKIRDKWVWIVVLLAPILSYIIDTNSEAWFGGLQFGFLILAVNGFLCFLGLLLLSWGYKAALLTDRDDLK